MPSMPLQPSAVAQAVVPADVNQALSDAVLSLSDGLMLLDREYRIVFANEQARRISRLRPEDLHGPTHWEVYPATVGTVIEQKYRRVMEERVQEELEFFYAPFEIWIRLRAFPAGDGIALNYADVTALKQATAEKESAAHRMREVLEAITDGVLVVDRNWIITYVNRTTRELVGAAAGDVVGRGFFHAFPGVVYPESPYVKHYFAAMHDGVSASFAASYGEPLNVEVEITVQPTEEGILILYRDVTQLRRDDSAIRASEAKYRVLTELGPQAVWTGSPEGQITYANQRFLEYLGALEITDGEEWLEAFDREDRQRVLEAWTHSVETGERYDVDARLVRGADGASRWWRLQAVPLRDEAGAITMWVGIANDIHDARVAQERLQAERAESERRGRELEAIYDTAPVGLALFEPNEFRYLQVNQRQAETLGLPVHRILGRRISEVVTAPEVLELFGRVRAGETVRDYTYTTEIADRPGQVRHFNVNYSPVRNDHGEVRAISAAVLDVTQQKLAEAALVQSEKLAAVGRLASSISHEINNPLEAVTNLLYLAQTSGELREDVRSYLRLAQDELGRVSQIATQTLRFHRQADAPTAVTAAQLMDPVLNLYAGRLVNSRIHVEAGYSTVNKVLCFENDIRQVINNLIANAIDAMRTGGRLMLRAHDACDLRTGTPGVRLTVADTGHGMMPETVERIFEPFYTTKGLNGNGLGLWISKGIVERHRGQLRVRSTQHPEMHGTVFTVFLPSAD